MFRHVFALLLINTYYSSLGNPIETSASKYLLSNSLTALASQCGNEFLSGKIKSRLIDCAVSAPPYREKQFECLIFYDINTRLCAAAPTLALSAEDTAVKINAVQNVNNLCNSAKDWVFTNLTDYVLYKDTADRVFKHPVTCGKVCGDEEVMSENANFYCKYFQWGSEIIKSLGSGSQRNTDGNGIVGVQADNKATLAAQNAINIDKTSISNQLKENAQTSGQSTLAKIDESTKTQMKPETSSTRLNVSPDAISESQKSDDIDLNVNKVDDSAVGDVPPSNGNKAGSTTQKKPETEKDLTAEIENDLPAEIGKDLPTGPKKDLPVETRKDLLVATGKDSPAETGKGAPSGHVASEQKDNSALKAQNDADDYVGNDIDSDEGKEGLDTQGGDDGEDPGDMDIKSEQGNIKDSPKHIEYIIPPLNLDSSQRQDVYPNTIPDGFDEDDDHFFPFFLTAIILVVVLYILYHNKNKVSKVVMGLILEGRQPGRRRNSRGHAYRRLDTLEQAMSANTAAPPSKIIY